MTPASLPEANLSGKAGEAGFTYGNMEERRNASVLIHLWKLLPKRGNAKGVKSSWSDVIGSGLSAHTHKKKYLGLLRGNL